MFKNKAFENGKIFKAARCDVLRVYHLSGRCQDEIRFVFKRLYLRMYLLYAVRE